MNQPEAKVAIVTGAQRGIGAAVAERLAKDGIRVVINYRGDAKPAQELARTIEADGGTARPIAADVSDPAAVRRMFDAVEAAFGGVDMLVNNAGVMTLSKVGDTDDETFDWIVRTNLKGTFNTLREAANRLRAGGRIVNLSSSVVGLFQPTYAVYAASKAAVEALTHVLSKELGERRITVNAVAPGPTETELFMNGKSKELVERITAMAPLGRLGTPEDIANAIAFLVSEDGAWINGQVLRSNGGVI